MVRRKYHSFSVGCLILIGVLCLICGTLVWVFESGEQVISASLKKWYAKRWLDATYKDLLKITNDVELVEINEPETTTGGTMKCVSATAIQAFGTNRSYDEVTKDYTSWSKNEGWKAGKLPASAQAADRHIFYTPDDVYSKVFSISRFFVVRPYQLKEPTGFETIYVIELHLRELRCTP